MKSILKNLLEKASGKDVERKIDIFSSIVERNKIMNSGVSSIDDVVAFAQAQNIEHELYL